MDVEYSFFLNAPGEDFKSLMNLFTFLAKAKLHLGSNLRMFTLLMMQPIRIYPHTRLADLAREAGIIPPEHDLIEGQYWNPGKLQYAVKGIQTGAASLYELRRRWQSARGETFQSVNR